MQIRVRTSKTPHITHTTAMIVDWVEKVGCDVRVMGRICWRVAVSEFQGVYIPCPSAQKGAQFLEDTSHTTRGGPLTQPQRLRG